jgi:Domain of unknown function (DUF4386)
MNRHYARLAGLLYLMVIIGAGFAELFVRQRFMVANDPAATARNILEHQQLFRWGFTMELIACLCNMGLAVMFWELFKGANRRVASFVVYCLLVGTAINSVSLLFHFQPLILLESGAAFGVDMQLLQAQAYMSLRMQSIGFATALSFFGLYCLALGWLIYTSRLLPRVIGIFLAIEGGSYLANSLTNFVAPGFACEVFAVLLVAGLAEVFLCLWLLVRGVRINHQYA